MRGFEVTSIAVPARSLRQAFLAAVALLPWVMALQPSTPAAAATYYISSSLGDDAWSGLFAEPDAGLTDGPKRSLSAAAGLLNGAAEAGDRVLFRAGDVWQSPFGMVLNRAQGAAGSPIVIGRYGAGPRPRFDVTSTGTVLTFRGSSTGPASYLRVEHLELTTTAAPGSRPGGVFMGESFYPDSPHHITLSHLVIHDLRFGLTIYADDVTIEGSTIRDNYGRPPETGHTQGIFASAERLVVRGNLFDHNGKDDSWFDHNLYLSHSGDHLVEGNEFRNAVSGVKLRRADRARVRGNTFHALELSAITVGGDTEGSISDVVIEGNLIYDTVDGITIKSQSGNDPEPVFGLTIRNNVIHSNRQPMPASPVGGGYVGLIALTSDPAHDVAIYNNAIYGASGKSNLFLGNSTGTGLTIRNNILHRTDPGAPAVRLSSPDVASALSLDHDLFHLAPGVRPFRVGATDYASLAAFRSAFPAQEVMGVAGDPALADPPSDFRLTEASLLAIDTGAAAPGIVDDDYDRRPRPADGDDDSESRWDIGPYERVGATIFADGFESGDVAAWSGP